MKKTITILLTFYLFGMANAQTIKGYVFSISEKEPVEFANILILNLPDSSMARGVISYMDGQYTAENMKPGKYFIRASFIGYQTNGVELEIMEGQGIALADTIFLSVQASEIDGVVVTGELIRAREMVDRTVYEILPEIEKTSTNGYDVLKKIPSVQVDFNNNVTLNGRSNFIIQIDGKQRDKEFLARILPADIEAIEIIHNPSGKYDGTIEGVINIIIKKEARAGINGNFGLQLKPVGKTTMGAMGSMDYGLEKITFYISGYSFIQNLANNTSDFRRISLPVAIKDSITDITGTGSFNITAGSINTGFDYYINDKNNLSLNYSYKPFELENKISNSGNVFLDDQIVNYQDNISNMITNSGESNISIYYRKRFRKPIQELTMESNYYFFNSSDDNQFNNILYTDDRLTEVWSFPIAELIDNNRAYFSTRVDYVHPIGISMRLETGYQMYSQSMDYDFLSSNDDFSNRYKYAEIRNAGYASFYWNIKDFSLQTTLRLENSNIDINKTITSQYVVWLPSSNLLYKFNARQNIKFTYNRRINRPGINNLNPFEKLNNNLSISTGNPFLKPEYRDRLQLTYTQNFKKNNVSPYLYHEIYSNKIDNTFTLKESPITGNLAAIYSPENILTGYESGLGLNGKLWFFNINGAVYKGHFNKYSDTFTTIEARDYFSFRINTFVYAPMFKEKVHAFAMVNYTGVHITAQSKSYRPLIYGFGAQHNMKNHTFGIFYLLPFAEELVMNKTITKTPDIYSKNTSSFDASWFIQVMYSYKFNKGRSVRKTGRQVEIESDTRGGGLGR